MSIALRQAYSAYPANSLASVSVVTGDLIVVAYSYYGQLAVVSCSDSSAGGSNTYQQIGSGIYGGACNTSGHVFFAIAKATETITVACTSENDGGMSLHIVSGTATNLNNVLDVSIAGILPNDINITGPSITTTNANNYIFSFWAEENINLSSLVCAGSGFSQRSLQIGHIHCTDDQIVSAIGTYTDAITTNAYTSPINITAAFKADTGGGGAAVLQSDISGSATLTASTLATVIKLAAGVTGSAAVQAALLGSTTQLSAAILAGASVSGVLTTAIKLVAATNGSTVVAANLATNIRLAAAVLGSSSSTAAITTAVKLSGSVSSSATLTANILTAIQLAASVVGNTTLSASFAGSAAQLAASVVTGATVQGTLTTAIRLAAGITGNSSAHATINTAILLAASALGSATVTANLSGSQVLVEAMLELQVLMSDPLALIVTMSNPLELTVTVRDPLELKVTRSI